MFLEVNSTSCHIDSVCIHKTEKHQSISTHRHHICVEPEQFSQQLSKWKASGCPLATPRVKTIGVVMGNPGSDTFWLLAVCCLRPGR